MTLVKIGFFRSAGSKNSRSQKILMWKILLILELFEGQKKKKFAIVTLSGEPFFVTLPNYPILTKKGCPCPLGGVGGSTWLCMESVSIGHSYEPSNSKSKNFFGWVHACIYVPLSVKRKCTIMSLMKNQKTLGLRRLQQYSEQVFKNLQPQASPFAVL